MKERRAWQDLSWPRLILGAAIAPVPALYIGFAAFVLANSDKKIDRLLQWWIPETYAYVWGFAFAFAVLYLNAVSRLRKRIGLVECLAVGGLAAFLLAEAFFLAVELDIMGPLPTMIFFPAFFLMGGEHLPQLGAILGLILTPAGILSGWIFWRLSVAPAKTPE
ncbi:hypothetical protein [Dongia sp.]|uniref:hypothetical protein n=1 Tax=Dongia sp. TaxID=1977262 RepID=UPI0035B1BBB9